jgi:diguanylate cyclase (GGDEF)-like protein
MIPLTKLDLRFQMPLHGSFDFAPYAQLLRTLLPRARGIYLYAPDADLLWSADGADLQDLRPIVLELLESAREAAGVTGTRTQLEEMPTYAFVLRDELGAVIGVLAVVCRPLPNGSELSSLESVGRTLGPVLSICRRELGQQRVRDGGHFNVEDTQELQWLFDVSHTDAASVGGDALQQLLEAFAARAACDVAILHVPSRRVDRLATRCTLEPGELDLLQSLVSRNLMRVAQLQQKTLIINRIREGSVQGAVPFRILCVPLLRRGQALGVAVAFNRASGRDFEAREARMLERLAPRLQEVVDTRFDGTTGLLTRHAFDDQVADQLMRAPNDPRWLVHADIDDLRATNELYGFNAGDAVLKAVAEIWRSVELPRESLTARLGSDSFVALLDIPSLEAVLAWTESLRFALSSLSLAAPLAGLRVTMGFGVAPLPPGALLEHALASAESACRAGKLRGCDQVEVYAPSEKRPAERQRDQRLYRELAQALDDGTLELHAQPLLPLWDPSRAPRYEILARLPGVDGALIPAREFMAIAERHRLAARLDDWVLGEALGRLAPCARALEQSGTVFSFNVSAQSLGQPDLPARIAAALRARQVPPGLLCFEFGEPALVAQPAAAQACLAALRELGCLCSIDDFGTGAAALSQLHTLPVSAIKIDGALVRDFEGGGRAEPIVRAILHIARQMGIDTVAECVETLSCAQQLGTLGVTWGQGIALGEPQPFAGALEAALRRIAPRLTEAVDPPPHDGFVH